MELLDCNGIPLQIGDDVVIVKNEGGYKTVGQHGFIKNISGNLIAVEHNQCFSGAHDCLCGCTYGLWYSNSAKQLRKMGVEPIIVSESITDLFL